MRARPATSSRSPWTTAHEPARTAFSSAASASASARERWQWSATCAPAACSRRAIAAPIRRAAPVTRTAPPPMLYSAALEKRIAECSPRLRDAALRRTEPARADARGRGALARGRRAHRLRDRERGGLDPLRALHGARALRAGPRLLRRRRTQVRRGGRLHHLARDLADVREVHRAAGAAGARDDRRGDPRAGTGLGRARSRPLRGAEEPGRRAVALPAPGGEPRPEGAPAQAPCLPLPERHRALRVARPAARQD